MTRVVLSYSDDLYSELIFFFPLPCKGNSDFLKGRGGTRYGTLVPPSGKFIGQSLAVAVKPAGGSALLPGKGCISCSHLQIMK